MIRILLVDDHNLVTTGLAALLNASDDLTVVGTAQTGEEAVNKTFKLKADLVMMDIQMPGIGGIEACRRILKRDPAKKIIALSIHNSGPVPQQILKLGVMGFISKGSSYDEMILAIRKVISGKCYICSEVANNLALQSLSGSIESPFAKLSQREAEVVRLILQGKSIQEMAEMLNLSDKTINTYRYRLYEKLQVRNDVELTCLAIKFNYIDPGLL